MIDEIGNGSTDVDDIDSDSADNEGEFTEDDAASTIVMNDDSVEINVEELVAKIESSEDDDSNEKRDVKRRLEKLQEEQDELESTYNFNLDEDL